MTVRASAALPAIERILKADNIDIDRLSPAEVATRMEEIEQGAAPREFWAAYQVHVRAWRAYATALQASRSSDPRSLDGSAGSATEARSAINRSFAVVEAIARRYGARIPTSVPRR